MLLSKYKVSKKPTIAAKLTSKAKFQLCPGPRILPEKTQKKKTDIRKRRANTSCTVSSHAHTVGSEALRVSVRTPGLGQGPLILSKPWLSAHVLPSLFAQCFPKTCPICF